MNIVTVTIIDLIILARAKKGAMSSFIPGGLQKQNALDQNLS